jgi:hypothetical protein
LTGTIASAAAGGFSLRGENQAAEHFPAERLRQ